TRLVTESWNPRVRSFAAVWCGAFVSALTLAAGCTEPRFVLEEIDGGLGTTVDSGAGADRDPCEGDECDEVPIEGPIRFGFPTWAATLPGPYALRARFYSLGANNAQQSHELIALAEIGREGFNGRPILTLKEICERKTTVAGGTTTRTVLSPQSMHNRIYGLEFALSEKSFSAQMSVPATVGYDPKACPDDPSKRPEQPWRTASACSCPSNLLTLPTKPDDCRVNDPDSDGTAGLQLSVKGQELDVVDHVVVRDASRFISGSLGEDKMQSAFLDFNEELSVVECAGERQCETSAARACPALMNPVEFVPAPGTTQAELASFNCGMILAQASAKRLFKDVPAEFPRNCQ
ncbi:MAG: hypothetical protein ABW252_00450, partial [Polyangiales bacterium]